MVSVLSSPPLMPKRELFREYGPGVRVFGRLLLGAGLGTFRGVPITLLLNAGTFPGVGASVGTFRSGDSGRGRDGRCCLGLNEGLGGRAPGPTDCENLGMPFGDVMSGNPPVPWFGVVGVGGNSSYIDSRREALCSGRNMPAFGCDVAKYRLL